MSHNAKNSLLKRAVVEGFSPTPTVSQPLAPWPSSLASPSPSPVDFPGTIASVMQPSPSPERRSTSDEFLPWVTGTNLDHNGFLAHTLDMAERGRTRAAAMGEATRKSLEELKAVRADTKEASSFDALEAIDDSLRRSKNGRDGANASATSVGRIEQSFENKAWGEALGAAQTEVSKLQEETRLRNLQKSHPPKQWREYASEASEKASRPFLLASAQAQQVAQLWFAEAQQARSQAASIRAESTSSSASSDKEAHAMRSKAEVLETRATQMQITAEKTAETANEYYKAATEAARRAGENVHLPGDPTLPPIPVKMEGASFRGT